MRLTLLLVCVGRSPARGALWLPSLGCEAPYDGTNGHQSSCWDPGGWPSHHQSNVQGLHQLKAGSLHHTHTHTHTTTTACGAILCGPGVHVCCLRAAGVLWVCVEVLWTLGVGMQEHMTTPSIHPTNTHTHTPAPIGGEHACRKCLLG